MSELLDLTAPIQANTLLIVIQTWGEVRVIEPFRQTLAWCALY